MNGEYDPETLIQDLAEDKHHGAEWTSIEALKIMAEIAVNAPAETIESLLRMLQDYAIEIIEKKPMMAPLYNKLALLFVDVPKSTQLDELRIFMAIRAKEIIDASNSVKKKLIRNAQNTIGEPDTVFTFSNSQTILAVVEALGKPNVIVTESRPHREGAVMAEKLGELGVNTLLVIDAAMGMFIEHVDVVIVSADSIQNDGSFINKVGTRLLAIAAKKAEKPFYVVSDSTKFNIRSYLGMDIPLEDQSPDEVALPMKGVTVRNPYFEVVPADLVTGIITEEGLVKPTEIRRKMESMRKNVEALLEKAMD